MSAYTTIAVFNDHSSAEEAITQLGQAGFDMKNLSIVGKGYHTDEKVVGFYSKGDRVKFWGKQGAFWGGMWGLFVGGLFMTIPVVGHLVVLGYLASATIAGIEGAAIVGGTSALAAALYGLGVKKDSVVDYEFDLAADHYLVMAHGDQDEMARAKALLEKAHPVRVTEHSSKRVPETA